MAEMGSIRVIVYREGDHWSAHCLEVDIGAEAKDLDQLGIKLIVAVECGLARSLERTGRPFADIPPAPACYQAMWQRRTGEYQPTHGVTSLGGNLSLDMALCA